MKVGFIGVGNMGGPMCRNIIRKSNHDVTVFDLDPAAVERCTSLGAKSARSIAELAAGADVIMTSLPMPKDVEAVALGPDGILDHARKGTVYFDLSTNSPSVMKRIAERLAAKGIVALDSPVSGGVGGAEAGTIAIMVGGEKSHFDLHLPLLQSFSGNVYHMGGIGTGCIAKIVNNMVAFCNMTAGAEGLMLGTMAGIDAQKLTEVISNSSGNSFTYRSMADKAIKRNFVPGFALDLAYKDMRLALELAEEVGMPLFVAPQVHNILRLARAAGWGKDDTSSLVRVYERTLAKVNQHPLGQETQDD